MRVDPDTKTTKSQKKRGFWRIAGITVGTIAIIWFIIYLFPVSKTANLDKFDIDRPLVIAHQGGEGLAPSSTLPAFINATEMGVDVLEFDVHMTSDGHLVAIHDPNVDRTTNGSGLVNEMTLEEVQALDAGYYFKDLEGNHSFRDKGVYIPTVEEIFQKVDDPDMLWVIEVKDTNKPELYQQITENLWSLLEQYGYEDQAILASFEQEIVDIISDVSDGKAIISAGRKEATRFVLFHKLFLNSLYHPGADAINIPTEDSNINLVDKNLIRGAHNRGMDVHYWTINDTKTMKELIELGADGIITDRPDLLIEILEEEYEIGIN